MPPPLTAEPPSPTPTQAFLAGFRAAATSPLIFVSIGTYLGIGGLANSLGFSPLWVVSTTLLIWAAPAQLIVITAFAAGSPLFEVAVAVALSAVRFLPMTVSLIPLVRTATTRARDLLFLSHSITVTTWAEGLRLLPSVPRENRIAFANGVGAGFISIAMLFTVVGFALATTLPTPLAAGLLFLTPLAFFLSTTSAARMLTDRIALVAGLVAGPLLAAYQVQFDLLWSGLVGGTAAYAVGRLWRSQRPRA